MTRNLVEIAVPVGLTASIDSPADKEAWATYRQSLRDLPEQKGFPLKATFPTAPVE